MSTAAQVLANQANAKLSTGPVTPEGKARVSHNAATLGLFSASAFIRPDEQEIHEAFRADWLTRLVPDGPLEHALTTELVQAAWRLRRCSLLEASTPEATCADDLDRMQSSIDRARAAAQRALQRNIHELRRIQTERRLRDMVPYGQHAHAEFGLASIKDYEDFGIELAKRYPLTAIKSSPVMQRWEISKQSQSAPEPRNNSAKQSQSGVPVEGSAGETCSIARSAPCPCGSGEKYKRCCGHNAPPVLSRAA